MQVKSIMNRPAITCRPGDNLNAAAQQMWEHDCGALPVVDDDGALVGMITDRDICMAAYTRGTALQAISVADAMAHQVFACLPDDLVSAAERMMRDKQIRRVPVVDGQRHPVGVLSLGDIACHASSSGRTDALHREVTRTLAAICQRQDSLQAASAARPPAD